MRVRDSQAFIMFPSVSACACRAVFQRSETGVATAEEAWWRPLRCHEGTQEGKTNRDICQCRHAFQKTKRQQLRRTEHVRDTRYRLGITIF